jgi:hypothetical protein
VKSSISFGMPELRRGSMILEYYIIAALSFAAMYTYNYGWEITKTVLDVLFMFDIDYRDSKWHPWTYMVVSFIAATLAMPLFLIMIIFGDKYTLIKDASSHILEKRFGFKKDDN